MPPTTTRQGGRFRRAIWIVVLAAPVLGALVFIRLGTLLVKEDPLQPADAIFVLAGSQMTRPLEAADLYREGLSRQIVMTAEVVDRGVLFLSQRGVHYPTGAELQRNTLVRIGIPLSAILIPPGIHSNTAQEARTLRDLAQAHRWRRVIVVTSKYHTRRAAFAIRRALNGTGVDLIMRASRYDDADPEGWWRHRADIRIAGFEAQKFVAYLLGLGE